jgi:hypothetical protein
MVYFALTRIVIKSIIITLDQPGHPPFRGLYQIKYKNKNTIVVLHIRMT